MLRLIKDDDLASAVVVWDGLQENEKRMMFFGLVAMVNKLRGDRGDSPDATYGPPETQGL
jgi:hypothetical protein